MTRPPLRERLLSKAVINWETGCWEWSGAKCGSGYGQLRDNNHKLRAHRVSYELLIGPIPEGLQLDHLCRNRACINPAHLEPVTPRENTLRSPIALQAINARKTHCDAGHELSDTNVRWEGNRRVCRSCGNRRQREYTARRREMTGVLVARTDGVIVVPGAIPWPAALARQVEHTLDTLVGPRPLPRHNDRADTGTDGETT